MITLLLLLILFQFFLLLNCHFISLEALEQLRQDAVLEHGEALLIDQPVG